MELKELEFIAGLWKGKGTAEVNSVKGADYDEETIFEFEKEKQLIFYVQKTWRTVDGKRIEMLHFESGFIRKNDAGIIQLSNSQGNGRVEVMELEDTSLNDKNAVLMFVSKSHGNDPRMIETTRQFTFNGSKMKYEMKMATIMNDKLTGHLRAELEKAQK
ncbi:MAG: FABP family protein [Ignavibacteria bacterium]